MRNCDISYFKLEQFKPVRFDSVFKVEALQYRTLNSHRAIFHLYGDGGKFEEDDLKTLRGEIITNLSPSWIGNFAFGIVLHDFEMTDEFHYKMVDGTARRGGACLFSIIVQNSTVKAKGIHSWQASGMSQIYEEILGQYPNPKPRYKTPPSFIRWLMAIQSPWMLFDPTSRPWKKVAKFYPAYEQEESERSSPRIFGFGYKMQWYAFRSDDQFKVAEALEILNLKKVDWETGVDAAYQSGIFITPPIDGWILVAGWGLSDISQLDDDDRTRLESWSREFGEVQYFATHRGVEAHCWIRAVNGSIVRAYSFADETLLNIGPPCQLELLFNLADTNSPEAENDDYWEREDIHFPNEEMVMRMAAEWSINPSELENRADEEIPPYGLMAAKQWQKVH